MDDFIKRLPGLAREETRPVIPVSIRWKSRFFGKQQLTEYLWNYYREQAERRRLLYLSGIYMREEFHYLCRYGRIPQKQVSLVLIDGNDARTDCLLYEFLGQLNFLTIVSERREYFSGLAERAFQELGLLIELVLPWEVKTLRGNLVWDFSEAVQCAGCYPQESICLAASKTEGQCQEIMKLCPSVTVVRPERMMIGFYEVPSELAEAMLVPENFPFRQSRCEELRRWCAQSHWHVKMKSLKTPC